MPFNVKTRSLDDKGKEELAMHVSTLDLVINSIIPSSNRNLLLS